MLINTLHILELIIGVGLLVFVHELGHLLAAKYFGVKATVFSLGFGPRLVGFNWSGTDCRLSLIPFGGYVMLPGEIPEEGKDADPAQLANRPPWQRIIVFSAGVVMNVVLALILFAVALSIGVPFPQPVVGQVEADSAAAKAGIQRGDRIIAINGKKNPDLEEVLLTIAFSSKGEHVALTVDRDGLAHDFSVTPERDPIRGFPTIGFTPASDTRILEVDPDSIASKAGLRVGDRLVSIDGLPVFDNSDVTNYLISRPDTDVPLTVERDGQLVTVSLRVPNAFILDAGFIPADHLTVKAVAPNTPAANAGLLPGDVVLSVADTPAYSTDIITGIIAHNPDVTLPWVIKRADKTLTLNIAAVREAHSVQPRIGIVWDPTTPAVVGAVVPDSPLARAGLRPGDRITAVNSTKVENWHHLEGILLDLALDKSSPARSVTFTWKSKDVTVTKSVILQRIAVPWAGGDIGIYIRGAVMKTVKYPLYLAPVVGVQKTVLFVKQLYLFARALGQRRVEAGKALGGPVKIGQIAWQAASVGPTYLMHFLAIIGLNLAFFNFLPIPFLDGGHVLLTLIGKIRGRSLSPKTYEILSYIGLVLILGLALLITYNDIRGLFGD